MTGYLFLPNTTHAALSLDKHTNEGGIKSFIHQIAYLNHTTEYAEKADFFLHKKLTGDENNIFDPAAKLWQNYKVKLFQTIFPRNLTKLGLVRHLKAIITLFWSSLYYDPARNVKCVTSRQSCYYDDLSKYLLVSMSSMWPVGYKRAWTQDWEKPFQAAVWSADQEK